MAIGSRRMIEVVTTKMEPQYVLTLSEAEAATLLTILENIGGPADSPRGHADSVAHALKEAGVERGIEYGMRESGHRDSIYFQSYQK